MKVTRRDYGQGSQSEEQKLRPEDLLIDRLIYRKLGSWTENRTVADIDMEEGDYGRLLRDFSNYYDRNTPTAALRKLDETLSTFDYLDHKYPFNDYYETQHPFGDLIVYNPIRNVVHGPDNIVHNQTNVTHNMEI